MCSPFALPCVALSYAHTVRRGKEKNETREDEHEARQQATPKGQQANTKLACNTQHTCEEEVSARAHLASCCAAPRQFALNE